MNVLVILGHPRSHSLCGALADAYAEGAARAGACVRTLRLGELDFDPHVRADSPERQAFEPDIEHAVRLLDWADHLAFVYPTWWGTMPALLKGFLDRALTPGFAFRFNSEDPSDWTGLWAGKSARLITTMDTPPPVYRWLYCRPGHNAMRRATLGFCGVAPVRALVFGSVKASTPERRRAWLERARRAGFAVYPGVWARARAVALTWLRALRLQFYPMSWAAYTMGALAAAGSGAFAGAAYGWGYLCLFALEAATVFVNDYVDYPSDRRNGCAGPFTGGSRVLVERRLGFGAMRIGISVALAVAAAAAGLALVTTPSPGAAAVLLGLAAFLTLGYTTPPLKLCYRGLGELDVAFTHSFLVLLIGHVLQGGAWQDPRPWLLALPLAVSILPAIILSALPDHPADTEAGKGTLAVRLGPRRAVQAALAATGFSAALAVLWPRLPAVAAAYRHLAWFALPHAALLGVLLVLCLERRPRLEATRMDGVMVAALSYILWFVIVPFWHLAGLS